MAPAPITAQRSRSAIIVWSDSTRWRWGGLLAKSCRIFATLGQLRNQYFYVFAENRQKIESFCFAWSWFIAGARKRTCFSARARLCKGAHESNNPLSPIHLRKREH